MISHFPQLPYSDIQDHRPKRVVGFKDQNNIQNIATSIRQLVAADDKFVSVNYLLEVYAANCVKKYQWTADDTCFENMPEFVDAFCDFSIGRQLFLREQVHAQLSSDPNHSSEWMSAQFVGAHEAGHIFLPSHERKLKARKLTGRLGVAAAAHNETIQAWQKNANSDLEAEANIFARAFLVPITKLDGSLSIEDLSQKYFVNMQTAYLVAMECKDYWRVQALRRQGYE